MKHSATLPAATHVRGFTLVELVMVIIVLAVLGGMAAPRFFDRKGYDSVSYNEQLKAMLRYGQKIAIAQGRNVYVRVNASGVVLAYDAFYLINVAAPGGTNNGSTGTVSLCGSTANRACAGVPSGLTLTGGTSFYFDPNGKPFLVANTPPTLTSTFTNLVLSLTGDGSTQTTTVAAETGYVY